MKLIIRDIEITPMLMRHRFIVPTWRCESTRCVRLKINQYSELMCINLTDKSSFRMDNGDCILNRFYGTIQCCDRYRIDKY